MCVCVCATNGWGRYDYFNPSSVFAAGATLTTATPLQNFPVFAQTRRILPLNVSSPLAGHGAGANGGGLTFLVHTPDVSSAVVTQDVHEFQSTGVQVSYQATAPGACGHPVDLEFNVTATPHRVTLLLQNVQKSGDTTAVKTVTTTTTTTTTAGAGAGATKPSLPRHRVPMEPAAVTQVDTQASPTHLGALPQLVVQLGSATAGASVVVRNVEVLC